MLRHSLRVEQEENTFLWWTTIIVTRDPCSGSWRLWFQLETLQSWDTVLAGASHLTQLSWTWCNTPEQWKAFTKIIIWFRWKYFRSKSSLLDPLELFERKTERSLASRLCFRIWWFLCLSWELPLNCWTERSRSILSGSVHFNCCLSLDYSGLPPTETRCLLILEYMEYHKRLLLVDI